MTGDLHSTAPVQGKLRSGLSVTQRILLPTLAAFTLLLLGLGGLFLAGYQGNQEAQEDARLRSLEQAWEAQLAQAGDLATALANQTANDPLVKSSFADQDREGLANATLKPFLELNMLYDVPQHEFHLPPAMRFLRLQDYPPEDEANHQADDSQTRLTVMVSNAQRITVSGIEMVSDGLSVWGVAPVNANGKHIGTVDYGINLDQVMLAQLKQRFGSDWSILLSRAEAGRVNMRPSLDIAADSSTLPGEDLFLHTTTLNNPVFAPAQAYMQAMNGEPVISRVTAGERSYALLSAPLRNFSGSVIGVVDILLDRSANVAALRNRMLLAIVASISGLLLIGGGLTWLMTRTLLPISELQRAAAALAAGDLSRRVPLPQGRLFWRHSEIEDLGVSFNRMAQRLRDLIGNLERTVAERTHQLERRSQQVHAASEIARDITLLAAGGAGPSGESGTSRYTTIETILDEAVNLIRDRFEFYHAGIFLIPEAAAGPSHPDTAPTQAYAVLRAATGDAGRRMLAEGHRLQFGGGQPVGIVGNAIRSGEARIAEDVTQDATHFKNPLLPETRAEMALPLRVGEHIIGALDVQSKQAQAFSADDITILQTVADQLAVAIQNSRLIQQLNQAVEELRQAQGMFTQRAWENLARAAAQAGEASAYRYMDGELHPMQVTPHSSGSALSSGEDSGPTGSGAGLTPHSTRAGQEEGTGASIKTPIRIRDEQIGEIQVAFDTPYTPAETAALVDEVALRLALVLESTRLLQEAQRLALREQRINLITNQVRASANIDTILETAVRELGRNLKASRAYIQIGASGPPPSSGEGAAQDGARPPGSSGTSNGGHPDHPGGGS